MAVSDEALRAWAQSPRSEHSNVQTSDLRYMADGKPFMVDAAKQIHIKHCITCTRAVDYLKLTSR